MVRLKVIWSWDYANSKGKKSAKSCRKNERCWFVPPVNDSEIRLTSWYGKYPVIYRVLYIPSGAGCLPSTVSHPATSWHNITVGRSLLLRVSDVSWCQRSMVDVYTYRKGTCVPTSDKSIHWLWIYQCYGWYEMISSTNALFLFRINLGSHVSLPPLEKEQKHLEQCFGKGYVSSQEGSFPNANIACLGAFLDGQQDQLE